MQERFDKYAADYAGFAAEGRPAEGMMWSVTGMQYEQGPEVARGEMLVAERKKQREVMEAVEVPTHCSASCRSGCALATRFGCVCVWRSVGVCGGV